MKWKTSKQLLDSRKFMICYIILGTLRKDLILRKFKQNYATGQILSFNQFDTAAQSVKNKVFQKC